MLQYVAVCCSGPWLPIGSAQMCQVPLYIYIRMHIYTCGRHCRCVSLNLRINSPLENRALFQNKPDLCLKRDLAIVRVVVRAGAVGVCV